MPAFGNSRVTTHCTSNEAKITRGDDDKGFAPRLVGNWLAAYATAEFKIPQSLASGCIQCQGITGLTA